MSSNLPSVDITDLATYLQKVDDIPSVSKMMGGVYLRDFIKGQDVAGQLLAKAIQADVRCKAKLDQAKAEAYLDRAADYLKQRSIKESSEARKMYVDVDPDVIQAQENKAKTEALVSLMKNKLSVLRQAHDDLKKLLYGDNHMTGFDGM